MGIKDKISGVSGTLGDFLTDVYMSTKRNKHLQVKAFTVYPHQRIEVWKATFNEEEDLVHIPFLHRIYIVDRIYNTNKGRVVFISYKYHKSLDLEQLMLPTEYDAFIKYKPHKSEWFKRVKLDKVTGTINLNLLDNDLSPQFSIDAHKITKTKVLEFMKETPRRILVLTMLFTGALSLFLGFLMGLFFAIIFFM